VPVVVLAPETFGLFFLQTFVVLVGRRVPRLLLLSHPALPLDLFQLLAQTFGPFGRQPFLIRLFFLFPLLLPALLLLRIGFPAFRSFLCISITGTATFFRAHQYVLLSMAKKNGPGTLRKVIFYHETHSMNRYSVPGIEFGGQNPGGPAQVTLCPPAASDRRNEHFRERMEKMPLKSINFAEKFAMFHEHWSPKCVARLDNYIVKVAKIKGHFTWHDHSECDEIFMIHKGNVRIDFRDGSVELKAGEMFVVPRGKEHKPFSENESEIILLEREDVVNTGDVRNEFTKEENEWI
jgi:mannose-6-phosphate isomerase-like protein (cupin superfamily)